MHTKLERFARGLILAPLAPLAGFLAFWWAAYALLSEPWIPFAAMGGLLAGILADIFLLKKLLERRLGLLLWVAVFLFYSIGIFGFFMGVPVFNVALAIPAGVVIGSRLAAENADRQHVHQAAQRTAWFTSGVLALICAGLGAGGFNWWRQHLAQLPNGIVSGNGRIEAQEIDVDTKFAGRVAELLVDEGDLVSA